MESDRRRKKYPREIHLSPESCQRAQSAAPPGHAPSRGLSAPLGSTAGRPAGDHGPVRKASNAGVKDRNTPEKRNREEARQVGRGTTAILRKTSEDAAPNETRTGCAPVRMRRSPPPPPPAPPLTRPLPSRLGALAVGVFPGPRVCGWLSLSPPEVQRRRGRLFQKGPGIRASRAGYGLCPQPSSALGGSGSRSTHKQLWPCPSQILFAHRTLNCADRSHGSRMLFSF